MHIGCIPRQDALGNLDVPADRVGIVDGVRRRNCPDLDDSNSRI